MESTSDINKIVAAILATAVPLPPAVGEMKGPVFDAGAVVANYKVILATMKRQEVE